MKKYSLFCYLFIIIFLSAINTTYAQNWDEMNVKTMELYNKSDFNAAIENGEKTLIKAESEFGNKDSNYATSLNSLALVYQATGQYERAESLYVKALKINKKVFGEKSSAYATNLNYLALLYDFAGDFEKSETLFLRAIEIGKSVFGEKNKLYSEFINNLAGLYEEKGEYEKAEPLYLKALEIRKELLGEKNPDYLQTLNDMGILFWDMGRYDEAEINLKQVLENRKVILGEKHFKYAVSLNNMALFYQDMGKYNKSEPLYMNALDIYKELFGEKHPNYATTVNNLAILYNLMGQYDNAERLYLKALEIDKEMLGEKHPSLAVDMNNLAELYIKIGNYEKAKPLCLKVLEIDKEALGEKHPSYAMDLNNLADLFVAMKDYEKAEPLYLKAINIRKEIHGENHVTFVIYLSNLGRLYSYLGKNEKAESFFKEAVKTAGEVLGEKHPFYSAVLNKLARLYVSTGEIEKAEPLFKEANKNLLYQVKTFYPSLSEKEKLQFLKIIEPEFDSFNYFVTRRVKDNPSISQDMFDLRISTKGLILNTTSGVKSRIIKSGDNNLTDLYNNLIALRNKISQAFTLSNEERNAKKINLTELESGANELEKELSLKSEDFKSELENRTLSWKNVQEKLNPEEAAIEFIDFGNYEKDNNDTVFYCALIIRNGYENPVLVNLCRESELSQYLKTGAEKEESYVRNEGISFEIYKLIWKPLLNYLQDIKTIYISPSGLLNKISFSALCTGEDTLISDVFSLHYSGNLKDIVTKEKENPVKSINGFNAVIFGGADFNLDSAGMMINAEKYKTESGNNIFINFPDTIKEQSKRDFDSIRSGWGYLKGTLEEADKIKRIFENNRLEAKEFTGADASEDALKSIGSLSLNKSPDVLHISTHGFFFPELQKKISLLKGMEKAGSDLIKQSENPLLRSGLVFSGANHFWQTNKPIEGIEDGILTAYEVSNLNLMNTELVVLSACETGLGDIKGGEGVFGLQRAFKTAGAKSVIMSLWKVPDRETMELMELFYSNWIEKGMSKYESLNSSQKEMRAKGLAPYYWAAFILAE